MAEVKNSFLQSKMNKDLDDRLIPNGQYREALNISVGKSENNNVGVLQNILGNAKLNVLSTLDASLTCIGAFMDNQNNRIYQFLTNYTDLTPENITLCDNITPPTGGWVMKITVYDFNTNPQYKTLVSGTFLNLSTTNLIIGVNLVEGLLFWTDNRNQPRKINVESAINNPLYYTTETQISVAKYAPIDPISMFRKATVTVTGIDTEKLSYGFEIITGALEVGMTLVTSTMPENGYTSIVGFPNEDSFELYTFDNTISEGDVLAFLTSTMTNKSDDPTWPGDPSFLEDKYVRFSYRFKFDDNEYSLIAPFTQIAYIPKQKGYFVNGDEASAYKSTVLSWMENNVNNIELLIPLPDTGNNIRDSYKIMQLDILYKESDALSIKVLDSIDYTTIRQFSPNNNIYNYPYQSQKPFKTLPDDQVTRVYDNVPVRALAQESVGNRIVYGNFYNTYSPPQSIDYNTTILPKSGVFTNFIEYPNHTIKQNRNYQVGFILADKFGRQSSVILSTVDLETTNVGGTLFGGSTVYAPYEGFDSINIQSTKNWLGNAIVAVVNSPINSVRDIQAGTPGLYAEPISNIGFIVLPDSTTITDNSYQFTIDSTSGQTVPAVGHSMRGAYTDYVTVIPKKPGDPNPSPPTYFVRTSGRINDVYLSNPDNPVDSKFTYKINEIGWYSYRVVVKQQQQEYYNVYHPGMLDGYPSDQTYGSQVSYDTEGMASIQNGINTTDFPVGEIGKTSHIVLINDNINKVPRDLVEVGPDQKLYRSSVSLYGKVENSTIELKILADIDYLGPNPFATSIVYKLEDNGDGSGIIKTVVPGNGIQSDEANEPIENPDAPPPTIKNPKAWYANTVVTSNELYSFNVISDLEADSGTSTITLQVPHEDVLADDEISYTVDDVVYLNIVSSISGDDIILSSTIPVAIPAKTSIKIIRPTHGIITFTPPNYILAGEVNPYINYTVVKGENIQYFPTRKADVVTAIATANDFNFLENDVNNVKGTAGLNFYQLQTKPSIGRVSVVNPIGVTSNKMVPFLSVYETTPTVSALQLFWETASTGLVSDLNYDTLVGYDGPVGFGNINFVFYENQDPTGSNPEEGEPDSKWITNTFTLLNNTGLPVSFIGNPILVSVFDNSTTAIDVTSKFGVSLNEDSDPGSIRLFIKESFVFDHNAPKTSSFNFLIKLEWSAGEFITLPVSGRLRNIGPTFILDPEDYNTITTQELNNNVVTLTAKNGSNFTDVNNQIGLFWDIVEGNDNNYFSIDSSNGKLSLINDNIPLGLYYLEVRVRDAFGGSPLGPLVGNPTYYGTLSSTVTFTITIRPKPVNNNLQYYEANNIVYDLEPYSRSVCNPPVGLGYAAIYVGELDLSLDSNGINLGLPDMSQIPPFPEGSPPYGKAFQSYVNVGQANGAVFGSPTNSPKGLTQGSLEWILINNANPDIVYPDFVKRSGDLAVIIYYRENSSLSWTPIVDDNGWPGANIEFFQSEYNSVALANSRPTKRAESSTSFVTSKPGEYCVIMRYTYSILSSTNILKCDNGFKGSIIVKDANYSYINPINDEQVKQQPFPAPTYKSYEYELALNKIDDEASSIPYLRQIADFGMDTRSLDFSINGTTSGISPLGSNIIKLNSIPEQILPGLFIKSSGTQYFNKQVRIASINNANNEIILEQPNILEVGLGVIFEFSTSPVFFTPPIRVEPVLEGDYTIKSLYDLPDGLVAGSYISDAYQWQVLSTFEPDTKILSIDPILKSITLDKPAISSTSVIQLMPDFSRKLVADFVFSEDEYKTGTVWASTNSGTNVKQFFLDENLTIPFIPPIANRFYVFQNKNRSYFVNNTGTEIFPNKSRSVKPFYYCGLDAEGKIIEFPNIIPTVQWAGGGIVGVNIFLSFNFGDGWNNGLDDTYRESGRTPYLNLSST